jgi:aminoglycoside phosphotransferase (APT) family kinase protein
VHVLPSQVAAGVAAILGDGASVVEELAESWTVATRTVVVATGAAGPWSIVQWSVSPGAAGRRAMGRRLRLGRMVARLAPALPVPQVLGGDADGTTPYVVFRLVAGISGRELLGDDAGAAILGDAIGGVARQLAGIATAGLRLSRTWSDPDRLGAAAGRWLEKAGPSVHAGTARRVRDSIERLPDCFAGVQPVFAHGDLAPVNVLMRDGAVVALLDLERARLAHRLFDAAWLRLIIRCHHPSRWPASAGAFFSAAGIEPDAGTLERLNLLAVLQCLEMLVAAPAGRSEVRRDWADRLVLVLNWEDRPESEDRATS